MKDITELIKDSKLNHIPRDIFYIILGFSFLLVLNFILKPTIDNYPNYHHLNAFFKILSVISISYFIAIFFREIGVLYIDLFTFLFRKNKIQALKVWFKAVYKSRVNCENTTIEKTDIISQIELDSFILKEVGHLFNERHTQLGISLRALLGLSLFLAVVQSPVFLITSLIILILSIKTDHEIFKDTIATAEYLLKKRNG